MDFHDGLSSFSICKVRFPEFLLKKSVQKKKKSKNLQETQKPTKTLDLCHQIQRLRPPSWVGFHLFYCSPSKVARGVDGFGRHHQAGNRHGDEQFRTVPMWISSITSKSIIKPMFDGLHPSKWKIQGLWILLVYNKHCFNTNHICVGKCRPELCQVGCRGWQGGCCCCFCSLWKWWFDNIW